MVELLIKYGADVDMINEGNNTAMHEAVKKRDARIVNLLMHKGANIMATN